MGTERTPSAIGPEVLEESAEELYENAPCGYFSTLPDGTFIKANQTFLTWTGYRRDELLSGWRLQDLLTVAGKVFHETHYAPLLRMQGSANEIAFDLVCADRRALPVLINTVQKRDASDHPLLNRTTVFNATDRRRYERELLKARRRAEDAAKQLQSLNETLEERVAAELAERMKAEDALRQAQKMELLGQLTGGVAHDFNNFLTVVMGGLEAIGREVAKLSATPETARIVRARNMAMQGVQRAAAVTHRLLAFARRQPLDPRPIDVNKLVAGMSDLLQRTLGETIALETVLAAGLWRTQADASELENAVLNLAINARDAMPQGGRLTIETANTWLDEEYLDRIVEPVSPGQYVLVAVTDTGVGMDGATLEKVFEPFFTTKEVGKGTGLGLSQVYGFVRQSGGHVRLSSEPGVGTTAKIYLPRLDGEVPAEEEHWASRSVAVGAGEPLLVVEDDDDLRAYSAEALRELGYQVFEAGTGKAALRILEAHPEIRLLFTDVVLPDGMNGRELSHRALRRRQGLKVLFTTGYTPNAIVLDDGLNPDIQLITKPFTYSELASKVRRLLDAE